LERIEIMKRLVGALVVLVALASFVPGALAASSGTSNVTLAASANSMIQILDTDVILTPTSTDYDNDFVQVTGASGLRVQVKTNSTGGMVLRVKCADATPQIALSDLLVRTTTAAGTGGSTLSSFTAITASDQNLWSTTVAQHPWFTVTTDLQVQNLGNYNDAAGGGTTLYTDVLTYTVVSL
jgi:hypothetical protein